MLCPGPTPRYFGLIFLRVGLRQGGFFCCFFFPQNSQGDFDVEPGLAASDLVLFTISCTLESPKECVKKKTNKNAP